MSIHKPVNSLYKPIKEMSFNLEMGVIKDWHICYFSTNATLLGLNKPQTRHSHNDHTCKT